MGISRAGMGPIAGSVFALVFEKSPFDDSMKHCLGLLGNTFQTKTVCCLLVCILRTRSAGLRLSGSVHKVSRHIISVMSDTWVVQ